MFYFRLTSKHYIRNGLMESKISKVDNKVRHRCTRNTYDSILK